VIRTLVIEDDARTAEAHAAYLARIDGFELAGIAATAAAAQSAIKAGLSADPIDLLLLDMTLPDGHGLELARRLRSAGVAVDIIAITAVRDIDIVHNAISVGIAQYLIKPFSFATFRSKLVTYLDYRRRLATGTSTATQSEVDAMLASLHAPTNAPIPKGLSVPTLESVVERMRETAQPVSAVELAESTSLSRVTARRYLEYLADTARVRRSPRYGTPGRPELEYRWID
jgi:response regulator of citrate/malate metabolism